MEQRTAFVVAGGGGRYVTSSPSASSRSGQHHHQPTAASTTKDAPKFYSVSSQRATAKARRRRWREATAPLTDSDYQRVLDNLESSTEDDITAADVRSVPTRTAAAAATANTPNPHRSNAHTDPFLRDATSVPLSPPSQRHEGGAAVASPPFRTAVVHVGSIPSSAALHSRDLDHPEGASPPSARQQHQQQYLGAMSLSPIRSVSPRAQKHRMIVDDASHFYRVYSPPPPRASDAALQNGSDEDDVGATSGPDKSTQKGRSPPPPPRTRPPPREGSSSRLTSSLSVVDDERMEAAAPLDLEPDVSHDSGDDAHIVSSLPHPQPHPLAATPTTSASTPPLAASNTVVVMHTTTSAVTATTTVVTTNNKLSVSHGSSEGQSHHSHTTEGGGYVDAFSTPPDNQLLQFIVPPSPAAAARQSGASSGAPPSLYHNTFAASPTHSAMFAGSATTNTRAASDEDDHDEHDMTSRTITSMLDESLTSGVHTVGGGRRVNSQRRGVEPHQHANHSFHNPLEPFPSGGAQHALSNSSSGFAGGSGHLSHQLAELQAHRHQRRQQLLQHTNNIVAAVGEVAEEDGASNWSPEFLSPVQRPPTLTLSPLDADRDRRRLTGNDQASPPPLPLSPPTLVGVGVVSSPPQDHTGIVTPALNSKRNNASEPLEQSPIIVPTNVLHSPDHIASRPDIVRDEDDVTSDGVQQKQLDPSAQFVAMVSVTLVSDDDESGSPFRFHREGTSTSVVSSPHLREGRMSLGSLTQDLMLRQDDDRRALREVDKSIQDVAEAERLALEDGSPLLTRKAIPLRAADATTVAASAANNDASEEPVQTLPNQQDAVVLPPSLHQSITQCGDAPSIEEEPQPTQPLLSLYPGQEVEEDDFAAHSEAPMASPPSPPPQLVSVYITSSGSGSSPPRGPKSSPPPNSLETVVLPSTSPPPPLSPPLPTNSIVSTSSPPPQPVPPSARSRPLPSPSSEGTASSPQQSPRHSSTTSPPGRSRPLPTSPPLTTSPPIHVSDSPPRQRPLPLHTAVAVASPVQPSYDAAGTFTSPPRQRPLPSAGADRGSPPPPDPSSVSPLPPQPEGVSPRRTRPLPASPPRGDGMHNQSSPPGDAYSPSEHGVVVTAAPLDHSDDVTVSYQRTHPRPLFSSESTRDVSPPPHAAQGEQQQDRRSTSGSRPLPFVRPLPLAASDSDGGDIDDDDAGKAAAGVAAGSGGGVLQPSPVLGAPLSPASPPRQRPLPSAITATTTSAVITSTVEAAPTPTTRPLPTVAKPKQQDPLADVERFTASMNIVRRAKVVSIPVALREYVDACNAYLTKLKLARNKLPALAFDAVRDVLAFATSFAKASLRLKDNIASSSLLRQSKLQRHHPWVDATAAEGDEAMYSRLLELIDDEVRQVAAQVAAAADSRTSVGAIEQLLEEHKDMFLQGTAVLSPSLLSGVDLAALQDAARASPSTSSSSTAARASVAVACKRLVEEMAAKIREASLVSLTTAVNKCRREEVAVSLLCDLHRIYPCGFVPHDASTSKSIASVVTYLMANNQRQLAEASAFGIPTDDDATSSNGGTSPTLSSLKGYQDRAWALRDALVDFEESATLTLQSSPPRLQRGHQLTGGAPLAQRLSFVAQATSQVQHLQEGSDAAKLVKLCADSHRYCSQSTTNFQSVHENPGYVSLLETTLDATSALLSSIDTYTVQLETFAPKQQLLARWVTLVSSELEHIVTALSQHAQGEVEEDLEAAAARQTRRQAKASGTRRFFIPDGGEDIEDGDATVHDALYHKHRHPQARLFSVLLRFLHRHQQSLDDTIAQRNTFLQRRRHMRALLHEEVEMVKHLVQIPLHLDPTALVWEGVHHMTTVTSSCTAAGTTTAVSSSGGGGYADERLALVEMVVQMNQQLSRANFLLIGNGLLGKKATVAPPAVDQEAEARQQDVLAALHGVHEAQEVIAAALRRHEQDVQKAKADESSPSAATTAKVSGGATTAASSSVVSLFGDHRQAPRPLPAHKAAAVLSKMKSLLSNGIVVFLPNVAIKRQGGSGGGGAKTHTVRAMMQLASDATSLKFHSLREAAAAAEADPASTGEEPEVAHFEDVPPIPFLSLEMILQGPSVPLGPTTLQCVRFLPDDLQTSNNNNAVSSVERHVYFPSFASFMEWSDVLQVLLQGRHCLPSAELMRHVRHAS